MTSTFFHRSHLYSPPSALVHLSFRRRPPTSGRHRLLVRGPEHARKGCGGKAVLRIPAIALDDLNLLVSLAPQRAPLQFVFFEQLDSVVGCQRSGGLADNVRRWRKPLQLDGRRQAGRLAHSNECDWRLVCPPAAQLLLPSAALRVRGGRRQMGAKNGKYQGDMRGGKRHGWGICAFSDRSFYEGEWVGDKMDGEGKYVRPDGSVYEGYWENNLQNGFGRLVLANGDVYEGSFRDGKMDGYGTYYYKNGSIYDGEFIEDEAHGVGTFKGVNGEFYQGEWQVDKMHGCGVYKFVGGSKFRGEWKYGKMDGYGVYENLEHDNFVGKFEGQFLDGKMDGLGLYYWPQGDIFMGEYAQDKRHGSGVYTSVRGAIYKGEYRAGDRSASISQKSSIQCLGIVHIH